MKTTTAIDPEPALIIAIGGVLDGYVRKHADLSSGYPVQLQVIGIRIISFSGDGLSVKLVEVINIMLRHLRLHLALPPLVQRYHLTYDGEAHVFRILKARRLADDSLILTYIKRIERGHALLSRIPGP